MILLVLCVWLAIAAAATPEQLEARLQEVKSLRELRVHRSAPAPSSSDLRKIAGGSVVTGLLDSSQGARAYGYAVVPVPIAVLWAALNDETRHPGYTAVAYSELLEGSVCRSGRKVLQYLPVPMLADRWWIGELTINGRIQQQSGGSVRELSWKSHTDPAMVTTDSGKKIISKAEPIGFSRGGWLLVALDERSTYVEYYLHTDPGGSIPSGMASMFATKGVRENIEAISRFAKEARPACPIQ